jgi:pyrroloquinoline quinone biosynthesis protein D
MILYPEAGLALSPTSAEIVLLCDGSRAVAQIVEVLSARYSVPTRDQLESDVLRLLNTLEQRGLVVAAK